MGRLGEGDGQTTVRLIWDGKVYYISGTAYTTKVQYDEFGKEVKEKLKTKVLANGSVCELFLFDSKLKLLTRHKVRLPMDNGGPYCIDSRGVGRAWPNVPALLYSVTYYQVGTPLAKRAQDIGRNWIYSTYLLRLEKDAQGHIHFVQDDSCLGSRNHVASIAQARKVLHARPQCEAPR